ncbi:Cro/CI family transcriptional regulator [Enterobacter ludwigii]|uniref:Cro/CI family transcriptional regulator n=1 Tax=Enterobacter ludwigii TaxID=299767 RepID=UPI003BEEDA0B
MKTIDAVSLFGSKAAVARALCISAVAVTRWRGLIPKGAALELEKITNGALKCDLSLYKSRPRKNKRTSPKEA